MKEYCPKCGTELESYSTLEGGWCRECEEWLPDDIIQQYKEA